MSSYQKLRADFEKAAPIMGEREKMEKAQNIMSLEQEIMKVEQDLTDQLAQEELLLTESYILKTNEYMQIIGKELGYDFVLSLESVVQCYMPTQLMILQGSNSTT